MSRLLVPALAVCALVSTGARAASCPTEKLLPGPSETALAGFELTRDKIPDVLASLGKPMKIKGVRNGLGPAWAKYKWTRGETAIGVSGTSDAIQILQVSSESADPAYSTGHGLRLGDDLPRVEALYGANYVEGHVTGPEIGERTVTYCYDDGTELSVGLDGSDRVTAIRITSASASSIRL